MMRKRAVQAAWLTLLLFSTLTVRAVAVVPPAVESGSASIAPQVVSGPAVTLRAGSGATIPFWTQNGETVGDTPPQASALPYLVLYRNGVLSPADERTLILEVAGIQVPAPGVTVTLEVETQHKDPDIRPGIRPDIWLDARLDASRRISVWQESKWVATPPDLPWADVTALFVHEFGPTVPSGAGSIATPTDYFRYQVTVTDADHPSTDPLYTCREDHAFLMENQRVARLPEVREQSPGAAPDELVVYYADMYPFRKNDLDPATWLSRAEVTAYVETELLPAMVEAFRVQSNEWGFPWYPAWIGRRPGDGKRLSVALSDGRTWFHGWAPIRGQSDISINVSYGNAAYDTLTDGLMDTFYHELFHNHQRNLSLHYGGDGWVGGMDSAWQFYSEGTATLVPSVGQPGIQFARTLDTRNYMDHANMFVRRGSGRFQDLITNDRGTDAYSAAVYWRFLYEQCGGLREGDGMREGVEDPAAGMSVIRRALTALYSGKIVDIDASTDLVGATPKILDQALAGSSCPFQTYKESLVAFSRAIYELRVEGGRCVGPGLPAGCGFYDPHGVYPNPPVRTIAFAGAAQQVRHEMMGGFGTDLIDVILDPAAEGQALMLEFYVPSALDVELNVQILQLVGSGKDARSQHALVRRVAAEDPAQLGPDGRLTYVIPRIRTDAFNRLGLIVTRLDIQDASDPAGEYAILLQPGVSHAREATVDVAYGVQPWRDVCDVEIDAERGKA
jgi:hypothetical protein